MSGLYDKAREKFLRGELSWNTDNIKAVLVDDADYTLDLVNHEFLSDIPAAGRVATSPNLTGKTTAAGVADADDTVFSGVSGDQSENIVLYVDTGTVSTSSLVCVFDSGTNLPINPNTGDINVAWDNGPNKIFKL